MDFRATLAVTYCLAAPVRTASTAVPATMYSKADVGMTRCAAGQEMIYCGAIAARAGCSAELAMTPAAVGEDETSVGASRPAHRVFAFMSRSDEPTPAPSRIKLRATTSDNTMMRMLRFRPFISCVVVFALLVGACGNLAASRMGSTRDRIEGFVDPVGFERVGVELVDEETGSDRHAGGFVVTWEGGPGWSPEQVLDAFVPMFAAGKYQGGYLVENEVQDFPFEYEILNPIEHVCDSERLRVFLLHTSKIGSVRLIFDAADPDGTVIARIGWDNQGPAWQIGQEVECTG